MTHAPPTACRCGAALPCDLPSIGEQDLFDGTVCSLWNCPACRTTLASTPRLIAPRVGHAAGPVGGDVKRRDADTVGEEFAAARRSRWVRQLVERGVRWTDAEELVARHGREALSHEPAPLEVPS